jgi:hypothetical protein
MPTARLGYIRWTSEPSASTRASVVLGRGCSAAGLERGDVGRKARELLVFQVPPDEISWQTISMLQDTTDAPRAQASRAPSSTALRSQGRLETA